MTTTDRRAALFEQQRAEAGVEADHVAFLDRDRVELDNAHQPVVADDDALAADMGMEVDHHPRPCMQASAIRCTPSRRACDEVQGAQHLRA